MAISTLKTYMKAAYFEGITEGLQGDLSACLKSNIPAFNSIDADLTQLWHGVDFVWSTVQFTGYSSADLEHLLWVCTINRLTPTTPDIQCSVRTLDIMHSMAPCVNTCVWLVLSQPPGAIQLWLHVGIAVIPAWIIGHHHIVTFTALTECSKNVYNIPACDDVW